jgi:hypothetical protein
MSDLAEGSGQAQLQDRSRIHQDALNGSSIGDLTDDDIDKIQLRKDALETWAAVHESATLQTRTDHEHQDSTSHQDHSFLP